jgi:hypothetical protein
VLLRPDALPLHSPEHRPARARCHIGCSSCRARRGWPVPAQRSELALRCLCRWGRCRGPQHLRIRRRCCAARAALQRRAAPGTAARPSGCAHSASQSAALGPQTRRGCSRACGPHAARRSTRARAPPACRSAACSSAWPPCARRTTARTWCTSSLLFYICRHRYDWRARDWRAGMTEKPQLPRPSW